LHGYCGGENPARGQRTALLSDTLFNATVRRVVQITPTNHLLTALAIADLLTMVSYLPYAVYFYCITCVTCITCIIY